MENNISRLRNAQKSYKIEVDLSYSQIMLDVVKILRDEGYIRGFSFRQSKITVFLKYMYKQPTFNKIVLISKPSRRIFFSCKDIMKRSTNKGTFIISTSQGILSSNLVIEKNLGGEVILFIN